MSDVGRNTVVLSHRRRRIRESVGKVRSARDVPNWKRHPYPFIDGKFDSSPFPLPEWREAWRLSVSVADVRGWSTGSDETNVDREGIVVDAEVEGCDLVDVTPSHQIPTAAVMSPARRKALLKSALKSHFLSSKTITNARSTIPNGRCLPFAERIARTAGSHSGAYSGVITVGSCSGLPQRLLERALTTGVCSALAGSRARRAPPNRLFSSGIWRPGFL